MFNLKFKQIEDKITQDIQSDFFILFLSIFGQRIFKFFQKK